MNTLSEIKKADIYQLVLLIWGERWGSNPRMTGPQPAVLTTSPHSPCTAPFLYQANIIISYTFCFVNTLLNFFLKIVIILFEE